MASTRFIGINTNEWSAATAIRFIGEMSTVIHNGNGAIGIFSQKLSLDDATPLRLMVGIPKIDLSAQQKKFAEAFHNYLFDRKDEATTIWTSKPNWQPINPDRTPAAIKDSRLDYEFLMTIGLRPATWENHVFITDLMRAKRNISTEQETLRFYLALSMFGFPDPKQFFTAA